jgi:thiamine-monophosphate kinase
MGHEKLGEAEVISLFSEVFGSQRTRDLVIGIGDDAAVVNLGSGEIAISVDNTILGIHLPSDFSFFDLGWKAVTRAVSDIAAMGAAPRFLTMTLSAPKGISRDEFKELADGLNVAARSYGAGIIGGDTTSADVLAISVCAIGVPTGPKFLTRKGAYPGDLLYLSAPVGLAALALSKYQKKAELTDDELSALKRPIAHVVQGATALKAGATAMIDISDGLALDADRLAVASNVGIELKNCFAAPGVETEVALKGGDDYVLLFSAPEGKQVQDEFINRGLSAPICIGKCTKDPNVRTIEGVSFTPKGFSHSF